MGVPSKFFCDWAASLLLSQIRQGSLPAYARIPDFVFEPFLTSLREQIQLNDRDLIVRLLRNKNTKFWGFFLSRGILNDDKLTDELVQFFDIEEDKGDKLAMFHHITARRLNENTVKRAAEWIESIMDYFIEDQKVFFSPKDKTTKLIKERMERPEFKNKRWTYLYSAHAAEDPKVIREFIEQYLNDADPQVAKTAERSLALLK